MNGNIYILTDGKNTKIGITSAFDKRMSSYKTHNANAKLFKSYPCDIDEAKRIEIAIKHAFKESRASESKEWFSVSPETIDRYVSTLLESHLNLAGTFLPSMHGIRLTPKAYELKEEITRLREHRDKTERNKVHVKKEELAELFAACFGLGLPQHKLATESVVVKDDMVVDMRHCKPPDQSRAVLKAVWSNHTHFPGDDHVWRYFHLVKLGSGHFVAICTARVSMPYLAAVKDENKRKIVDFANELGLYCTFHNDWSWHCPDETALILYQPKTPVADLIKLWDNSFRKWVIARQELLKLERFDDMESLEKVIEDTVHSNSFPLDVESYAGLCQKYLGPYWGIFDDGEDDTYHKPVYEFLFEKWRAGFARTT